MKQYVPIIKEANLLTVALQKNGDTISIFKRESGIQHSYRPVVVQWVANDAKKA